ncbi:response regulator transcription factor [Alkalicoccus urumqiensis]|uniref:response regulator transcription factor n=1 Tax=Alkalicoccus urumqiensis TaxID=1548213 RepID=UPI0015E604DF|nr:LuxR C-terminal-related transcriptional regulator [Alkalicoccus urumqiensis]
MSRHSDTPARLPELPPEMKLHTETPADEPDICLVYAETIEEALDWLHTIQQTTSRPPVLLLPRTDEQEALLLMKKPLAGLITLDWLHQETDRIFSMLHSGEFLLDPAFYQPLVKATIQLRRRTQPITRFYLDEEAVDPALSRTEKQILLHLANGCNTEAIAEEMFYSPKTVKSYISRLIRHLHAPDRTAVVLHAIRSNWLIDERGSS